MPAPLHLAAIAAYPVKSLRGHALSEAMLDRRGLAGDRRWLVVDARGRFVTRRERPQMATIDVRPVADGLLLTHPEHGTCHVVTPSDDAPTIDGTVWRDTLPLHLADAAAAAFLTAALGLPVRLAYQPATSRRAIPAPHAAPEDHVSLADGFPLLVTTGASLDALNRALTHPIGMNRFRPNLVIAGAAPWEEDHWRRLRIGGADGVVLRIARPCSRCIVVTQTTDTGERHDGNEPLATLRTLGRATKAGIMFGQNAIPETLGKLRIGDPVEIVESGASNLA
jgi:hypothetical protein